MFFIHQLSPMNTYNYQNLKNGLSSCAGVYPHCILYPVLLRGNTYVGGLVLIIDDYLFSNRASPFRRVTFLATTKKLGAGP